MGCTQGTGRENEEQPKSITDQIADLGKIHDEQQKLQNKPPPNGNKKKETIQQHEEHGDHEKEKLLSNVNQGKETVKQQKGQDDPGKGTLLSNVNPKQQSINPQKKTANIVRKSYIFIIYHIVYGFYFCLIKFPSTERSLPMTISGTIVKSNKY